MERLKLRRKTEPRPMPEALTQSMGTRARALLGRMPAFRKVHLTPELIARFCKCVKRGLPLDGACDYLGVGNGSFWSWLARGTRFLDGDGTPPEDALFGTFVQRLRRASAAYRYRLVVRLHDGAPDLWRREMSILSRRDRKNFGKDTADTTPADAYDPAEQFL